MRATKTHNVLAHTAHVIHGASLGSKSSEEMHQVPNPNGAD